MKMMLARFWDGLFPIPAVSAREAFLLRALLATALYWFFPTSMQIHAQPEPVGLAHGFDLTWLSAPGIFPVYRASFLGLLIFYSAGMALPLTLPLLTLAHILPATLHNSQGFTYHGNQIMSLTLMGLSVMTAWFALAGKRESRVRASASRSLLVLAVAIGTASVMWKLEKTFSLNLLGTYLWPSGPALAAGWCNVGFFVATMLCILSGPAAITKAWTERGAPSPIVRSWSLVTAQFVVGSAYLISVFSKMIRSDGQWLVNSYYVALDFVKTQRQTYYSGLDPQFAGDPPGYIVMMMQHPFFTALFFDAGVALEAGLIFAVGNRRWGFAFGITLIFMHVTIAKIMNLFFPTHVAMLAIFWVAPLLLGRLWPETIAPDRPHRR